MDYIPYLGDDRLARRVIYDSNGRSLCVYCGTSANSREHIPSKVFLSKPYPGNLSVVPACKNCNNSYSEDELYSWFLIKILEKRVDSSKTSGESEAKRFHDYSKIAEQVEKDLIAYLKFESSPNQTVFDFKSCRLERVLEKLAIGHSTYELSEGYRDIGWEGWKTEHIGYGFSPALSDEIKSDYNCAIPMDNLPLPEIGSRIYDRIYVVEMPLIGVNNGPDTKIVKTIFLDWVDVQENIYRYLTVITGDRIYVFIVIDEFLYASVIFRRT